ncbi:MAG: hypothetical protein RMK62_10375 [Armatimonadota bacterium]|nr:hypothetical protein [Armatimonadota bacterium]
MPLQLRRQLLGDRYGDYNFLADPTASAPLVYPFSELPARKTVRDDRWFQPSSGLATFVFDIAATHPRILRLSSSGPANVSHLLPQSGLPIIARFSRINSLPDTDGSRYILANPDTIVASQTVSWLTGNFVQLSASNPGTRWRVGLETPHTGGTIHCSEVKCWEFLDLDPYLSDALAFDRSTEVFTAPMGRFFTGRGAWLKEKSLQINLLIPRSETTVLAQLQSLLTPDPRHPLELFVDDFLWKIAPQSVHITPQGGLLLAVTLTCQLLSDSGIYQDRYRHLYGFWTSLPMTGTITTEQSTVHLPAEVRISLPANHGASYLRIICQPADRMMTVTLSPTGPGDVVIFRENGLVFRYDPTFQGQPGSWTDITAQLKLKDAAGNEITNGPPLLHPTTNRVTVDLLDSSFNRLPSLPSGYGLLTVAWNERKAELTVA